MDSKITHESQTRSFTKSFIWRIVGVILLASVTYFYTRKWLQTSWITFLHHTIFLFVFWAHERFWLKVDIHGLKRKFLKMLTYETILGNFILGIISLIITGNVQQMGKITITYIFIKHFIFIWNELIWERISWQTKKETSLETSL